MQVDYDNILQIPLNGKSEFSLVLDMRELEGISLHIGIIKRTLYKLLPVDVML